MRNKGSTSIGIVLLLLAISLPAHPSNPPRAFDACAGPPLPPPLPYYLAAVTFYESDPSPRSLYQRKELPPDMVARGLQGLEEQRRFHQLASEILLGSNESVAEAFLNPQPGDLDHFRPAQLYYFAYLHGLELSQGMDEALRSAAEHVHEVEAQDGPQNYIWFDAIANSLHVLDGSSLDVERLFAPHVDMESLKKEVAWLETLASLRDADRLFAAKRYEESLDLLERLGKKIESLVAASSGCSERPSIAVGEVVQNFVSLGSQLVVTLRNGNSLDPNRLSGTVRQNPEG